MIMHVFWGTSPTTLKISKVHMFSIVMVACFPKSAGRIQTQVQIFEGRLSGLSRAFVLGLQEAPSASPDFRGGVCLDLAGPSF